MAEPRARRELELRLKVTTDAAAAKAGMDQLAQSAERAERATTKAQRAATAGGGGVVGGRAATGGMTGVVGGTAAPAGGGVGGFVGGAGEMLAARFGITPGIAGPAAAALVAAQAARTGKAAADAYQDEMLTAGQRARKIVGSVAGGDTFLSFADTFTGRGRDMARAGEEGRANAIRSSAESQIYTTQLGLRAGVSQSRAEANALSGARAETTPYVDRTSAEGERRYRLESQLTALRERGATAGRAASAAREDEADAAKALAETEQKMRTNRQRQAEIDRLISGMPEGRSRGRNVASAGLAFVNPVAGFIPDALDQTGPNRRRLLDEKGALGDELTSLTTNQISGQQRRADAARRRIAGETEQARANGPERMRAEAAQLEDRAGRAMSAAERIGMSTPESAEEGYMALLNVTMGGIENADPSEIAAAQRYAPEMVARLSRQSGRANPLYDAFRDLSPDDYPSENADDLFRRANGLRSQGAQADLDIQARAAEQGARMAAATMDAYIAALKANIPNLIERAKTEILQSRSAASAGSN